MWWRQLAALWFKELRTLYRDPFLLLAMIWFFTVEIYVAGTGIRLELNKAPMAVVMEDTGPEAREWVARFHPPWFDVQGTLPSMRIAQAQLDAGQLMQVADIPPRFGEALRRGEPTAVQVFMDGSNVTLGSLMASYTQQIHAQFNTEQMLARLHRSLAQPLPVPQVDNRIRLRFNETNEDSWFMSVTELFMVLTVLGMLLPAALAVREKERGTIEQLLVAPLDVTQIMLAKVLAVIVVILLGVTVSVFWVIVPLIGAPVRGDVFLFYASAALYAFSICGVGLFISTLARNLGQVMLLTFMLILPMLLLSGAWTPPEAMPRWEQTLMAFTPLYHFNIIGNSILFKGAGLADLQTHLAALLAIGSGLFAFGAWRFRRQFTV